MLAWLQGLCLAVDEFAAFRRTGVSMRRDAYFYVGRNVPLGATVTWFKGYRRAGQVILGFHESSWLNKTRRTGNVAISDDVFQQALDHIHSLAVELGRSGSIIHWLARDPISFRCFACDPSRNWHHALSIYGMREDKDVGFAANALQYLRELVDRNDPAGARNGWPVNNFVSLTTKGVGVKKLKLE